ncbi:hypothetical protein LPB136_03085 [Tenacibaculum todarodis]|uniref:Uncharacterized protein n=1 Tax=Tenacibaculum todarodis TaxID=1850252 RepID=A0A1L3JH00_9FLAO|nr:hypothetical protein LPB136_03085 [Tenacibaculum todarodis]
MKKVKTLFNILTILCVINLIFWFIRLNYEDLSFHKNLAAYIGIFSMIMMIISFQLMKIGVKNKKDAE